MRGAGSATDVYKLEVGARLRLVRRALGLGSQQIAQELGVTAPRWSQWETGRHPPALSVMTLLARRYGVTLDYIYRGEESGLPQRLADAIRALPGNRHRRRSQPR